ncbi:acetate--CoA ligase family protein [Aquibium sp. ELW1220]|uniref:acetate--CoA ligase family protein n=1 Tax=Aquibium sp. ELW1220 TaxID=2976766 RepID=UPI0025B00A6B|nr:acetate--CoA ligase family protein [Aquibium sp. ELW1220]MDN2581179.1 acetate--CoA ligase family protein [Aquibium sp. ELW1220]
MNAPLDHLLPAAAGLSDDGWAALSRPRSIALVGASGRASSVSFTSRFLQTNQELGYEGEIFLINPNRDEILGRKCWPNVAALPSAPDVVIINLPDEKVLGAVHEAIAAGAKALMIHSGGFGERGQAGLEREIELKQACAAAGVAALGPNCLGIMNLAGKCSLSSFRTPANVVPGAVAMISGSGSVAGILMHVAGRHGISFVASTGNEAVTTAEDLIERAILDDATRLIVCFIEALRQPARLFDLARRAHAAGKPIVVVKAGLTEKGGEVSRGHTGALAGSGAVYRQAFRQSGIVLVDDFDEMLQTVELLMAFQEMPKGTRVGMLGTSGGELGNVTDLCEALGVELPPLSAATLRTLQDWLVLPADVVPRNPVDVGTGFNFDGTYENRMRGAIRAVAADSAIDVVVVLQGTHRESEDLRFSLNREMMNAAARENLARTKPVVVLACQSGRLDEEVVAEVRAANVPALQGAREGLRALAHLADLRVHRAAARSGDVDPTARVAAPKAWENGSVAQATVFEMLAGQGLPVPVTGSVTDAASAAAMVAGLCTAAVMKIDTPRVVHKSDIGGVALGVTGETAAATFDRLVGCVSPAIGAVAGEAIFVSEQIEPGVELYVGAKRDATFGAVVVVGLGGRMLERLDQTALLVTPFGRADALSAIERSGAAKYLDGFRGGPVADLDAIADLVCRVGAIASGLGEALEVLDLNPVIVSHKHRGGRVADARLILSEGTRS